MNRDLVETDRGRTSDIQDMIAVLMEMDDAAFDAARAVVPLLAKHSGDTGKAIINGIEIDPHPDHYKADIVSRALNEYLERIGNEHGIFDLAQDNGLRVLTVKLLLNLGIVVGRGGNDLFDARGTEYELKTLNLDNATLGVTTSHHLKHLTISRYRGVGFVIAAYRHGRLVSIYILHPEALEEQFARWEEKLNGGKSHLNNPLISISLVRMNGELAYGAPLPRRKPPRVKRQMEMDIDPSKDCLARHPLSSLEAGMDASLEKSRKNARIKLEKAAEKARKRALNETRSQCELPFN